jgi:pimeloyl-ACP methyl ester carboxylesterase
MPTGPSSAASSTPGRASRRGGPWRAGRRVLLGALALAGGLLAALLGYQAVGAALDERAYPPPGQLVDVGGYRLHLHCTGAGSPTVLLDAASQGSVANWGWLQPDLAATTRVCAYDRAGMGWSDAAPAPPTAGRVADALRTLLDRAGVDGPLVLVGHSLGGLYGRVYAARHPERIAGMVLLDAAHPDQAERVPEMRAAVEAFRADTLLYQSLARFGLFRLYFALGGEIDCRELPPRQCAEIKAIWSTPEFWAAMHAETLVRFEIDAEARGAGGLGGIPLMVVTAGDGSSPAWRAMQRELTGLSSNDAHRVVADASHMGLIFNPAHARATGAAIREVIEAARAGQALRPDGT